MNRRTLLLPLLLGIVALILMQQVSAAPFEHKRLFFLENKGQVTNQQGQARPDIDFKISAGNGLNIFIGSNTLEYQWAKEEKKDPDQSSAYSLELYRMELNLLGARSDVQPIVEEPQSYFERYYLPQVPEGTKALAYRKIIYKEVYPHIDWVLYFNEEGLLEHDFVVHPGGKVTDIRMEYGGATSLKLQTDGSLFAANPLGSLSESAPYSFQQDGSLIASRFVLKDQVLNFEVEPYSGTLIIDPSLEWGSYFGGLAHDVVYGAACDTNQNVYIAGSTGSADNIATTGAYQSTYGGPANISLGDAFLAKFAPDGTCLWATYYGGEGEERGLSSYCDPGSNLIYLAGFSRSQTTIASAGAHQTTLGGSADAFLVQFDIEGNRQWATYYGGSGADANISLGVHGDHLGNVYLCGQTASNNNIASGSAHQSLRGGNTDAFLVKFSSSGQRQWGTYLGGGDGDQTRNLDCDSAGNVYIYGTTQSNSGIATPNAFQESLQGSSDVFLSKFSPTGSLLWSTYFGGEDGETGNGFCIDENNQLYFSGSSFSSSNLATPGSHQSSNGGGIDAFLAAFDEEGQQVWATFYGGELTDAAQSIIGVGNNEIFLSGLSNSQTGITTPEAWPYPGNNSYQIFISKFSTTGSLLWATYYGGNGHEGGNAVTWDGQDHLYIAGQTSSAAEIATTGSHQTSFGGGGADAFLLQLNICEAPSAVLAIEGDSSLCAGSPATFLVDTVAGAAAYAWILPTGWEGSSDSASIVLVPQAGTAFLSVAALNHCTSSDTVSLELNVLPAPEPLIDFADPVLSTSPDFETYQWLLNEVAIPGATAATYTVSENGLYAVQVSNEEGCVATSDNYIVEGNSLEEVSANAAIRLYPNPASTGIYIEAEEPIKLVLRSIEGRLLQEIDQARYVDLRDVLPGMYWVQLYDQKGRLLQVEKLIKLSH